MTKRKSVWGISLKDGTLQTGMAVFGKRSGAEDAIAKISHLSDSFEVVELGPVNSPVIPDGWVACSERMPHKDGMYIAFDGHRVITAPRMWNHWQVNQLIEVNITHWMPLPAAPKPEK